MKRFHRKTIRLAREHYRGRHWYFLTLCCEGKQPNFEDGNRCEWLLAHLRSSAAACAFLVHAYCVMPDHVHLLVEATEDHCDLHWFVTTFKRQTAWEARQRFGVRLWQRFFYDHILRSEKEADPIAWYIWMNPVRRGLCADAKAFPHSGSFRFDWRGKEPPTRHWQPPWKD